MALAARAAVTWATGSSKLPDSFHWGYALETEERDNIPGALRAWQREVSRALERLDRLLTHLPVPLSRPWPALSPQSRTTSTGGHLEPDVDVLEGPSHVYVTLEMQGVEKRDINLTLTEEALWVKVDTPRRRYYREVVLPRGVDPERARASYRNGVLDVVLRRKRRSWDRG